MMPQFGDSAHEVPATAVEDLFRLHYAAVASYVRRRAPAESVDDVVAETFVVAWRRLERVPADAALPWLLAVARNLIATQRRGAMRREALYLRLRRTTPPAAEQPPSAEEPVGPVASALARLSEKDREALTLIAWDGLRPHEAAVVLGDLPTTFRARLHRAKRRLRRLLDDQEEQSSQSPSPRVMEAKESLR